MSSKKFTDLNAGTIGAGSIFAQAQEPALPGDPYTSTKVSATQIANYVAKGQAFPELNNQTLIQALTGGSGAGTVILTMAQYLALTPSQQTDGHIYVISDFACLFCYGRQYNALQELTRAQYDQLTPAQQSDGTLYILTDEETTADDIEYTSGVSVADKLGDLNGLVKVVFSGNISKTLTANQNLGILGTEIIPTASMPSGYTVIGLLSSYSTNNNCIMYSYDASAVGTSGTFCFIKNNTASSQSITVNYRILFMKSDYVS